MTTQLPALADGLTAKLREYGWRPLDGHPGTWRADIDPLGTGALVTITRDPDTATISVPADGARADVVAHSGVSVHLAWIIVAAAHAQARRHIRAPQNTRPAPATR